MTVATVLSASTQTVDSSPAVSAAVIARAIIYRERAATGEAHASSRAVTDSTCTSYGFCECNSANVARFADAIFSS